VTEALRLLGAIAVASTIAAIPAGSGASAHLAASHTVTLRNLRYHPGTLSVNRGDRVTWLWRDSEEHDVTFHGFHSRTQTSGSYTVRFTRSGTFNYRCTVHVSEGMRGKIVVH
jgi:plastocyanin